MAQDSKHSSGAQKSLSQSSGVDEQLLSRNDSKGEGQKNKVSQTRKQEAQTYVSYRQRVLQAKRKRLLVQAKKEAIKRKSAPNPMRKGTSNLLKQAWINIIDSFGLTIIWINIHVFLGSVFGKKFFAPLGSEWLDSKTNKANAGVAEKTGKTVGIFEKMGLVALDLGCLLLFLLIAGAIYALMHPIQLFAIFISNSVSSLF